MSNTTTAQTSTAQPSGTAQPATQPLDLEAAQVEADYQAHLEDRMGRYGY